MKKLFVALFFSIHCLSLSAMEDSLSISDQEYTLFKLIKKVRTIAAESRQEIKSKYNICDERPLAKNSPIPNFREPDLQETTESSLFVTVEDFPVYLQTPCWGSVEIRTTAQSYKATGSDIAASQLFFKRTKSHLVAYARFILAKGYVEVLPKPIQKDQTTSISNSSYGAAYGFALKKISAIEIDNFIGKSNFIMSTKCGEITRYKITEVDSEPVPNLENIPTRSPEMIEKMWKIMEARYEKEH